MRKIIGGFICVFAALLLNFASFGIINAKNSFQLVPEPKNQASQDKADSIVHTLTSGGTDQDFWAIYNSGAETLKGDLGAQIRSGVFSRDSVLGIGVYVLRFIMQLALVIGALMVIKSGYSYVLAAIGAQDKPEEVSKPIKNAILGLFIISISYTIIKLLQMAFLN